MCCYVFNIHDETKLWFRFIVQFWYYIDAVGNLIR